MFFNQWNSLAEESVGQTGHGSRKAIADAIGVTSETIRAAELRGEASRSMIAGLEKLRADLDAMPYPLIDIGKTGRWSIGRTKDGGWIATHLLAPLAMSVHVSPDRVTSVDVYGKMDTEQMDVLVDDAVRQIERVAGVIEVRDFESNLPRERYPFGPVGVPFPQLDGEDWPELDG